MCRLVCLWLLAAGCAVGPAWAGTAAAAPAPLLLDAAQPGQDAWPHVRMLVDDGLGASPGPLLRRLADFRPHSGPAANLGSQRGVVWLHLQVQAPAGPAGPWMLDIDNPALDRVDVFLARQGQVQQHVVLGDTVPPAERAAAHRTLVAPLALAPGQVTDLLLRVQSTGTLLMPLVLLQPEALQAREARVQLLQGLLAGVGLCLLVYSLLQWAATRDRMFAWYALSLAGVTGFFFAFHGLGNQHLWGDGSWMAQNAALLFGLVGLIGSSLFADRALQMATVSQLASQLMRGLALLLTVALLAWLGGLVSYHRVHVLITVLGVVPMLVVLPVAVVRLRQGDRAARYMLLGWAAYGAGVVCLSATLRGLLPVNLYTQYVFQLSSMVEMLMWMAVLGTRTGEMRRAAARARSERHHLETLAHTDALTGALNRHALLRQGQALVQAARPGQLVAVCMIDLDGFKAVNDQHGHAVGDQLLQQLAQRLQQLLRGSDQVVRTGGDEFVVVVPGLQSAAEADTVAAKLLQAAAGPFALGDVVCRVGLSVGYALAPDDAADITTLMAQADAAMYAAKAAGKNRARRAQPGAPQGQPVRA